MSWKTREEYFAELRAMRKNVWADGHLVEDMVTDPATRQIVETEAVIYDLLQDPKYDSILKTKSVLTGKDVVRWNSLNFGGAMALKKVADMKRFQFDKTGTCNAGICVGHNLMNVLWATCQDIDAAHGTNYQERLKKWIIEHEDKQFLLAGGLTDAKGDRSKSASQQPNPDANVHVKEVRPDGIVVSGTKTMIACAASCQEIFIHPGTGYKEADKDYAVAFVVPRDIEGLTVVQTTEGRDHCEGWDSTKYGCTASYLIFEDCFVPNDRVFMCGEYEFSGGSVGNFIGNYRACIGSCVAGQGDVMQGIAALMARANGLSAKTFKDKITEMTVINETVYGLGLGSILNGSEHPSGVWLADAKLGCVNKCTVAKNYAELRRILQDIGGGIAENGCLPSYADCVNPEIGPKVMKAVAAGVGASAESRAKLARLSTSYAGGNNMLAFIHGGGSPDGAKLVIRATTPLEMYAADAAEIAGLTETLTDPVK